MESVTPLELVQEALGIIETNALERSAINWSEQNPQWLKEAAAFSTLDEAHQLIKKVLKNLGDNHSFLIPAQRLANSTSNPEDPVPRGFMVNERIGIVEIPEHGGDGKLGDGRNYATVVQKILYDLEHQGALAWVIDLRRNGGGNMWPMLAGLTPLLGQEPLGAFINPHTDEQYNWQEILTNADNAFLEPEIQFLKHRASPVAVLTSQKTLSSGEATLIAFLGRPNTRTFGEPTGGLPTANSRFQLSDTSRLLLTTLLEADRLGRVYKSSIPPDVFVKIEWSKIGQSDDPVLLEARNWLQKML
jgi:carboxyl-terminal processing protease